jgi:hypothetical protein
MRWMLSSERTVVIGVAVSVIAGSIVGIWSSTEVGLGLAVGLLGTIVSLQLDTELRLEKRARRDDESGRLLAALDATDEFLTLFRQAAEACASAATLASGNRLQLSRRAREELISVVRAVTELGRGRVHADPGRSEMLVEQVRQTRTSLRAASLNVVGDATWWNSTAGAQYWEANQDVMTEHGVVTERIFICDAYNDDLKTVVERQARGGVRVYVAFREHVPSDLQTRFAIFDDSIVHEVVYGSTGQAIEYTYSADAADVIQAVDRFERLRTHARELITDDEGFGGLADHRPRRAHSRRHKR